MTKRSKASIREVNGYRTIYIPNHPSAMKGNWSGYVYEHVVVAEKEIGRRLDDNEVVHHLDGDRSNNRSENLLVLTRAMHGKLHKWIDKGAPGIERACEKGSNSGKPKPAELKYCKICFLTLQESETTYCSNECRGLDNRKVQRPTYEQLLIDIKNNSMLSVGKKYGVSDNAVRKWIKRYEAERAILSKAEDTSSECAETTGEV